jgi:hypothetical protein
MNDKSFSLVPTNLAEAKELATLISKSDLVPKDYQDKPGNVLVAIQMGQELGLQPMQALQGIAVINGRPSVWGDAMLALVRGNSLCESLHEYFDGEGDSLTAVCAITRKGEKANIVRRFSVADAKKASLWGKTGPWTNYPQRMLQMRARAWACRDAFPDVLKGISVAEEAQDIRDMGDLEVVKPVIQMPVARPEPAVGEPRAVVLQPERVVLVVDEEPPMQGSGEAQPAAVDDGRAPSPDAAIPIVKGAIKIVQMQMDKAKLTGTDLEAAFGVNAVEKLSQSVVNDVLAWAKGKANAPV